MHKIIARSGFIFRGYKKQKSTQIKAKGIRYEEV